MLPPPLSLLGAFTLFVLAVLLLLLLFLPVQLVLRLLAFMLLLAHLALLLLGVRDCLGIGVPRQHFGRVESRNGETETVVRSDGMQEQKRRRQRTGASDKLEHASSMHKQIWTSHRITVKPELGLLST